MITANDYSSWGYDPIPLIFNDPNKRPVCKGWNKADPAEQWGAAPAGSNIGLRCGSRNRLAVLDADNKNDPLTMERLMAYLEGLGLSGYPVIQTIHDGFQTYFAVEGELPGNYRTFAKELGTGEFRYGRGAYVAAVPSVIGDKQYKLLEGSFEHLPTIRVQDVLPILTNQEVHLTSATTPSGLSVAYYNIPRSVTRILKGGIDKGKRSEAEQRAVTSLANQGRSFEEIYEIFEENASSDTKFKSKKSNRKSWLLTSYNKAIEFVSQHPDSDERLRVLKVKQIVETMIWEGRTGSTDREVMRALCGIAYTCGAKVFSASSRTVAEMAGVGRNTATHSILRLLDDGWIKVEKQSDGNYAHLLSICDQEENAHSQDTSNRCEEVSHECASNSDVFRWSGLGKTGYQIYNLLKSGLFSIAEISSKTGRHRNTVTKKLQQMSRLCDYATGELMVIEIQGKWTAQNVNLDHIADVVGTAGYGERQKLQHEREREAHNEALLRLKAQSTPMTTKTGVWTKAEKWENNPSEYNQDKLFS